MNTRRDPDRLIHAFLVEGQTELADQVYDAVRSVIEQKRQRATFGPWRTPIMNKLVPIGLGAAAVVVALVIGTRLLGPAPSGPGGPAEPTATTEPSVAAPSPSNSGTASPAASPRPLTQTFTSQMHGISVSYPEGWIARAATEPWTDRPDVPQFLHPGFDVLQDPVRNGELFLHITSEPIGDSTPEDWVAASLAAWGCTTTEPIAVDGATGLIGADDCHIVAVTTVGRGYSIGLYTPYSGEGETPPADFSYDRAWFEEVLATVQLQPEDAVDLAPSTSP